MICLAVSTIHGNVSSQSCFVTRCHHLTFWYPSASQSLTFVILDKVALVAANDLESSLPIHGRLGYSWLAVEYATTPKS
jgi:hypothetical protein